MNFTYENQGINTYLVYQISENDSIDSMSLGMLTNNKISGLAAALFTQMDTKKFIKYNISAKISIRQFFSGTVNKKRLIGIFHSIVDGFLSAEDYMIDSNTILLDMDYIFADVSTCEAFLICLPIYSTEMASNNWGTFFKNIMFTTQFDQTENCDYVAKIINFLNSSPVLSLIDFKKILNEIKKDCVKVDSVDFVKEQCNVQHKITENPLQTTNIQSTIQDCKSSQVFIQSEKMVQDKISQDEKQELNENKKKIGMLGFLRNHNKENKELYQQQKDIKRQQKIENKNKNSITAMEKQKSNKKDFAIPGQTSIDAQSNIQPFETDVNSNKKTQPNIEIVSNIQPTVQSTNFGETTVLSKEKFGETTVLNGSVQQKQNIEPCLIRVKNNEKIVLNKPTFRIGKEKSYVDYFVSDNTAVSRSHADIITRDDTYFIIDTNSTNHTFINGSMIQSSVEVQITNGDKIRLGNEDFEFKLC